MAMEVVKDEEVDELQQSPVQESMGRVLLGMTSASAGSQPTSQQPSPTDSNTPVLSATGGPICANCSTQTTSLWRRSPEGQTLCNACSLYQKMKGTPRPVSLKTDTIKHRNRSKGDKKLKDGQPPKGKSKKASGAGGRGSSTGPTAGNRVHEPKMEGVVEEEIDEDLGGDETDELATENGSMINGSVGDLSSSATSRPRMSLDSNASTSATAPSPQHPTMSDLLRSQARSREMAAAIALANVSQQQATSNGRRSASADGRSASNQSANSSNVTPHYPPYNSIASLFNSVLAARHAQGGYGNLDSARLSGGRIPSASSSANPSPAATPSATTAAHHALMSNPLFYPRISSSHPANGSTGKEQLPLPTTNPQQSQNNYRDWSPSGVVSRTGSRSHSTTPTDTPQRSPLFNGSSQQQQQQQQTGQAGANGRNSPLSSSQHERNPPATSQQQPASRFAPAAFQLPSLYPRSASTDRYAALRNSKTGADGIASPQRLGEPTNEERERQKIRLDQLFAAAGQRLSETAGQSIIPPSPTAAQSQHTPTTAASGRTNTSYHSSASYKPYELHHPRSSSRIGHHASDSRFPSVLNTARTSPQQTLLKNGRPGSSASSSDDSNDAKRGFTSIASPAMQGYASPGLPPIPDSTDMAIDPRNGEREQASISPPFGLPSFAGVTGPELSASERRGRSTTRRARDGEVGDAVAHELEALRMRDSSQSSAYARSRSPAYLPRPHLAGVGGPGATIKTPDLDDGIVRDAMTHRPVSDLRASGSGSTLQTLPSLSEALSSGGSSRSISSGNRSASRQPVSAALRPASIVSDASPSVLPLPNTGAEDVARLRTRIQELEFINGLLEGRVAELESARAHQMQAPHGPNCACRCAEAAAETETWQAAEYLKNELASHGIQGIGEKQSRDLLDLLVHRLGYRAGDLK